MPRSGLDVEARVAATVKDRDRRRVDEQADDRDDEHPAAKYLARVLQPADGLDEDPDRDRDERDAVRKRCKDLGALEPERALRRSRALRKPDGEEREAERHRVGQHVSRVRQEGETSGEEAADDLGDEERRGEDEGEAERALGPLARMVVRMGMSHAPKSK